MLWTYSDPDRVTCGSSGAPPCFYSTVPFWQIDESQKRLHLPSTKYYRPTAEGPKVTCKACGSENQQDFLAELTLCFDSLQEPLSNTPVGFSGTVLVCLECGLAELAVPETALLLLKHCEVARPDTTTEPVPKGSRSGWRCSRVGGPDTESPS